MILSLRRLPAAVVVGILAFTSLHGCTSSDDRKIIGAWIDTKEGYVIEFLPNGTMQPHEADGTAMPNSAKWTFSADGRLKIDVVSPPGTPPRSELATVTFETDDRLVLLPAQDGAKPSTLQRLKTHWPKK